MKSSPRKAKFTRLILATTRRIPSLMPTRLRHLSTSYKLDSDNKESDKIDKASLFYDPERRLTLKGVNFVIEISGDELTRVQQWNRQDQISWIDERNLDLIYSRSYLSSPREYILGHVRFDGMSGFQCIDRIESGAKVFHGCLVSLVHLPSGSLYLNFFFWGGPIETSFVQHVSASHLAPTVEFQGYNLFRRANLVTSHFNRDGLADQMVKNGLDLLKVEAFRNLSALLKKMKIDISDGRYVFKAWEFINDDETLRYPSETERRTGVDGEEKEFVSVAHKQPDFYKIQDDGLYLDLNEFDREEYDLLAVKSKRFDSFPDQYELDQFKGAANQVFDSLVVMCLIGNIYAKVQGQLKILEGEIGFGIKASAVSKRQKVLFAIVESLSKIKDELGEMKKYKAWICPKPYMELFLARLEGLDKLVDKILQRAEREYKFTNDMIGINVVKSNNRFSWVLAFFALVQIGLAYLAVDWDKTPDASTIFTTVNGWVSLAYNQLIASCQSLLPWIVQKL